MNDFKDKVVYQIYPKSFMDSNGDGFGDLKGVTAKLDYLADLGVDYLWLTPFFPSPQRDNGYDVADYRAVDPRYGTMEDLEELIREADRHGIGLMLDMVFNHTSTEHAWFQRALAGEKKYQDYYIFKNGTPDNLPTNWVSKFGGPAWQYVPQLGKWYLHLFDVTQADLNWENPAVREEMADILRFWKAKGIKGFRFDVVNLISKPEVYEDDFAGDGRRFYTDGRNVHKYLKELVAAGGIDGMVTVGDNVQRLGLGLVLLSQDPVVVEALDVAVLLDFREVRVRHAQFFALINVGGAAHKMDRCRQHFGTLFPIFSVTSKAAHRTGLVMVAPEQGIPAVVLLHPLLPCLEQFFQGKMVGRHQCPFVAVLVVHLQMMEVEAHRQLVVALSGVADAVFQRGG